MAASKDFFMRNFSHLLPDAQTGTLEHSTAEQLRKCTRYVFLFGRTGGNATNYLAFRSQKLFCPLNGYDGAIFPHRFTTFTRHVAAQNFFLDFLMIFMPGVASNSPHRKDAADRIFLSSRPLRASGFEYASLESSF
jgi:hypothetical protein